MSNIVSVAPSKGSSITLSRQQILVVQYVRAPVSSDLLHLFFFKLGAFDLYSISGSWKKQFVYPWIEVLVERLYIQECLTHTQNIS